jgi:RNA polymerase sigma-B factor
VSELAKATGASEEAIVEAIEAGQRYRSASLDAPGVAGATLGDSLAGEDVAVTLIDERSVLEPALASLPDRNRVIMKLRFIDGLTQSEIASQVGISQMHVSRLLATSLAQLREAFTADL